MNLSHNLSSYLLFIICAIFITKCSAIYPVVLVPGDGGSQVEAKLDKKEVVHYICEKTTKDYFNIWLNMELLVPYVIDCWIDNIKLVYDNTTRRTSNPPGVTTRIPGWGSSEPVEWLDPSHASTGAYFKFIGDELVKFGYKRNVSIRGAPFDFRKAPNENQEFFVKLKELVEETYEMNGKERVILIAHSMGGPMSLYFLNLQTQAWKDKYIKCLVSLSGAWGGSVKAVKVFAVGDDLGSHVLSGSVMRQEQITSPSLAWLLPSRLYWDENEVLIETEKKNYSIHNLKDFFMDINYSTGYEMWVDTEPHSLNLTAPGVEVHCLYGTDVPTVEKLYYKPGTWLDGKPTLMNGDGDGTVNRRSLEGCLRWSKQQKEKIYTKALPKIDHMGILSDAHVLNYIQSLINMV